MWRAPLFGLRKPADPNVVPLLSLKLLLLAFFILLTSLSQFQDDRTRLVLDSVNEAFNGRVQAEQSYSQTSSALDNLEQIEAMFGQTGELFRSTLPAVRVEKSADRPLVRFELPADTLFAPDSVRLRPGRWLLLRRLADALSERERARLPFRLTLQHGLTAGVSHPAAGGGETALALRRLAALSHALTTRGLPPERLAVGLLPSAPGVVRFELQLAPVAADAAGKGS